MAAWNSINLILLIILSQIFTETPSKQHTNGGSVESILSWKLQNHVYKTLIADVEFECVFTSQPKYAGK